MAVKITFECNNISEALNEMVGVVASMMASNGYELQRKPLDENVKKIDKQMASMAEDIAEKVVQPMVETPKEEPITAEPVEQEQAETVPDSPSVDALRKIVADAKHSGIDVMPQMKAWMGEIGVEKMDDLTDAQRVDLMGRMKSAKWVA